MIEGKIAVIGASDKPDRYSYKACSLLLEHGYQIAPVHPVLESVLEQKVYKNLAALTPGEVDTVTVYVRPETLAHYTEAIIALKPRRVIMNPGTENSEVKTKLTQAGISVIEACTLVLLKTDQFEQ